MTITSLSFLLLGFFVYILYFTLPRKLQWWVLLGGSMVFYLAGGVQSFLYVLITALTVYGAAVWMADLAAKQKKYLKENKETLTKEQKTAYKKQTKKKRSRILTATVLLNIGLLCYFKYFHFALEQVNVVLRLTGAGEIKDTFSLIVPLGISFYTFQTVGYLADVYWEYYQPEKNFFKVLLFTSFFPQMTQGPISEFEPFSKELFGEHELSYDNFSRGSQRMLWGFLKKMVIANTLAPYVQSVFQHYPEYTGLTTLLGAFLYSVQIYADFSGYMDIMCGYCQMLGIRLTENFMRPYFSKSVSEYWRRWHISLGNWFKKYIYYPIGMSAWSRKLAQNTRKRFGKHFGDTLPASIALVVTWLATGLWHGASWAYITWGLVNGLFIIFSLWMEPVNKKFRDALKLEDSNKAWRTFQVLRTFIVVTFIKVLPEVGTLSDGLNLWKHIFTDWRIVGSLQELLPFVDLGDSLAVVQLLCAVVFTIGMLVFSLLQRREAIRDRFARVPLPVRIIILAALTMVICSIGINATMEAGGGFMYENF